MTTPLSESELQAIHAYWRAANYLSVGQIYLLDNPLLREPLVKEHVKPRLLGHWGTTPGLNFIYDALGSNAPLGRFDILELVYQANGAVERLALNFDISDTAPDNPNLKTGRALGYLRYNSVIPLIGRTTRWFRVGTEEETCLEGN